MNNKTIEIRTNAIAPVAGEGRTISGYAIVFGVESRVLPSWDGEFVEIIDRSAVSEDLLAQSDVKALFNHVNSMLLARSVNGVGTLRLDIDDHGLRFEFEAPNTSLGSDVLELVRRGDLQGCSFAFTAEESDIEYSRDGDRRLRRVKKLSGLYDVSVVVDPAYTQTSVDARSFEPLPPSSAQKPSTAELLSPELAELRASARRIELEIINTNL